MHRPLGPSSFPFWKMMPERTRFAFLKKLLDRFQRLTADVPVPQHISFRALLLFFVTGTVIGFTLLILICVLLVAQRASREAMLRDSYTTSNFLSEYLRERTLATDSVCRAMGTQPTVLGYLMRSNAKDGLKDWMNVSYLAGDVRSALGADSVFIANSQGSVIGHAPTVGRPTEPFSLPNAGKVAFGRWQGIVEEGGRPAIAIRVPIVAPGKPFVKGAFYTLYFLDHTLAKRLHRVLGTEVGIVHKGKVVASSLPLQEATTPVFDNRQNPRLLTTPIIGRDGQRFQGFYQNIAVVGSHQSVGILVLRPEDEVNAFIADLQTGLLLSALLLFLFAVMFAKAAADRIARPLDSVVTAARSIQTGKWPAQISVDRIDEIGVLQSAFNEMSTAVQSAQERLLAKIDTDPLTELDNHRRFKERLTQELLRASTSEEPLVLVLVDIDCFHWLNLEKGLPEGDRILCLLAGALRSACPTVATLARYDGDIFSLLVPRTDLAEAERFVRNLHTTIRDAANGDFTVSIGYSVFETGPPEPETLLLASEFALTQAKYLGRNRIYRFDPNRSCKDVKKQGGKGLDTGAGDLQYLYRLLRDGSLFAIQALAAAVDAKDHYTEGHSRRVGELAARLAERIGLSRESVDHIYTAAVLHDVGKIGVPDHVLQKQEKLTDEELRMMRAHPEMGEMIVSRVPQLRDTAKGIRSHHERWDGRGYPDGLQGEEIPLEACIIALADTFDAMTTDRPYQPGSPVERVLLEIERGAGKQFAPDLVPPFLDIVTEKFQNEGMQTSGEASPENRWQVIV